mgnify:CR=1 FL=1
MIFKSEVDLWLWVIVALVVIISLVVSVRLFLKVSLAGCLTGAWLMAIGIELPLWLFYTTHYVVKDEVLQIQSGPFKWTIPITSISQVVETSNPRSSPALSLRRLEITYGESKTIMVSPKDREGFLEAIGQL